MPPRTALGPLVTQAHAGAAEAGLPTHHDIAERRAVLAALHMPEDRGVVERLEGDLDRYLHDDQASVLLAVHHTRLAYVIANPGALDPATDPHTWLEQAQGEPDTARRMRRALVDDTCVHAALLDDAEAQWLSRRVRGDDGGPWPTPSGSCWNAVRRVPRVLARLWRPRHTGKIALAREVTELLAAHFPDRTLHTVGDAAYVGEHLRGLNPQITWTSRPKATSVLHELPPPRTGKKGRPRTRGPRLGTPTDLSQQLDWHRTKVRRHGRVDTVFLAEHTCLWYGSFHTRPITVVLVWDSNCGPGTGLDRGYGAALVTTDLTTSAEQVVERYAARWAIETAFSDARQTPGVGEAGNRTRLAVERAVPFGLLGCTVVTTW